MGRPKRKKRRIVIPQLIALIFIALMVLTKCNFQTPGGDTAGQTPGVAAEQQLQTTSAPSPPSPSQAATITPWPSASPVAEPEPEPEPTPMPWEVFSPYALPETDPFSDAFDYKYDIQAGGEIVDEYLNPDTIFFGMPEAYAQVSGVVTFRGNNFRNNASFGTADIKDEKLTELYRLASGTLDHWTGVGWSGQPVIVQWDYEIQQHMNMLPDKIEKEGLVEVIQGAVDGYVYFFDLEDGKPTRNPFRYGEPIKGGVSMDPRGYPILFIGQGDQFGGRTGCGMYSLIDLRELFYLPNHDPFALRFHDLFDSNPLFDAANDRLFECGENGLIYNIKLNTEFDREAGTISVDPEIVRYRYTTKINAAKSLGVEGSPSIFSHYIFTADNGGLVQCVDLMTFEPVWARDCTDDIDSSVVLDWEEDNQMLALYTGCETDYQGFAYIRKLNAENGELLWEHSYPCLRDTSVSGGVLGTPVAGRGDISGLVIFWVGKVTGMGGGGVLVAFDKISGDIVWETVLPSYGWSSPTNVYTGDGKGYIVVCDATGKMFLVRGTTGEVLDSMDLGGNVEASPAVYGSTIVVGTRGQRIYGIRVS